LNVETNEIRPRVKKIIDGSTKIFVGGNSDGRWGTSHSLWDMAGVAIVATSAMTVVSGRLGGELHEYSKFVDASNTYSLPKVEANTIEQLFAVDENLQYRRPPQINYLFEPTLQQSLQIEKIATVLEALSVTGLLCYEGEQGEVFLEAGPSDRSLTFLLKPTKLVALYREGDDEEFSSVSRRTLPVNFELSDLFSVVTDYLRAVNVG
jgi:hypothetical protein